jgi:hypothetical protein
MGPVSVTFSLALALKERWLPFPLTEERDGGNMDAAMEFACPPCGESPSG